MPWKILVGVSFLLMVAGCNRLADTGTSREALEKIASTANSPEKVTSPEELEKKVRQALLENLRGRKLSATDNAAWQVMHGVLAYGKYLDIDTQKGTANALEYLLGGGSMNGWDLGVGEELPTTKRVGMKARLEPGSYTGQGHVDQWIAILSQINIPLDQPVIVNDQTFTMEDWVRQSQWDVSQAAVPEYSWTVIAMTHYFPQDQSWQAKDGNLWTLEQLVQFESEQDLPSSACGGTHRLMSLARAIAYRKSRNESMTGGWLSAQRKVEETIQRVRQFQNDDGTFSCNYTERPGRTTDLSHRISSTGHMLEFLAFTLPPEELQQPWMTKAVDRLCDLLHASRKVDLECGGLYHALAGLRIYHERVYGPWVPDDATAG